jgi:bifunctional N-acetylglucosamine-1-phosphate-uridyltransferase/glucosamine-1-phosphate-acetyltransferase GlmU-like protein
MERQLAHEKAERARLEELLTRVQDPSLRAEAYVTSVANVYDAVLIMAARELDATGQGVAARLRADAAAEYARARAAHSRVLPGFNWRNDITP